MVQCFHVVANSCFCCSLCVAYRIGFITMVVLCFVVNGLYENVGRVVCVRPMVD